MNSQQIAQHQETAQAPVQAAADTTGLIIGPDGRARPKWAAEDALLRQYYDHEWGAEIRDEHGLFERLCLEGFQAGLSWKIVLTRREALREAFAGFSPDTLAQWGEQEVQSLMENPKILRNRRKIEAVLSNARATVALREHGGEHGGERGGEHGGLAELLWSFAPEQHSRPAHVEHTPSTSEESHAMAQQLKKLGFRFVGPTTCYALMQAVGMVDDRPLGAAGLMSES
ncbi:DNA-3-methyladenine glycosylase I [Corynebacterium sp. 35RC1]|nr:DNA-3-methyladenine glycosylase I [Corynebacterium sp. 35RC1]